MLSTSFDWVSEQDMAQIVHRQGEGSNKNGFSIVSSDKEALRLRVQDTQNAKQMQAQKQICEAGTSKIRCIEAVPSLGAPTLSVAGVPGWVLMF